MVPADYFDLSKMSYDELLKESKKPSDLDEQIRQLSSSELVKRIYTRYGRSEDCRNAKWYHLITLYTCIDDDFNHNDYHFYTLRNLVYVMGIPLLILCIRLLLRFAKYVVKKGFASLPFIMWWTTLIEWTRLIIVESNFRNLEKTIANLTTPGIEIRSDDTVDIWRISSYEKEAFMGLTRQKM